MNEDLEILKMHLAYTHGLTEGMRMKYADDEAIREDLEEISEHLVASRIVLDPSEPDKS